MKLLNIIALTILGFILTTSLLGLSDVETFIFGLTLLLIVQGGFATFAMLYSFLKPENLQKVLPPRVYMGGGWHKYSIILPAKNEAKVIGATIKSMANLNYPKHLYEVLVVVRNDDIATLKAAEKAISSDNIRVVKIDGTTVNKPYSLNMGWLYAKGDIITVFDAEDEPHPDILRSVDEVFIRDHVDIVQAGVQLVNVGSHWFAGLNCLEYYYWFKSILPFMSGLGATPLGGNTVFFKRKVLEKLDGWREECLTEDADIGIRASAAGFKTKMIYVEDMATQEETPANEGEFIRQRTRWDQGYLQILIRGDWLKLSTISEQFLSFYLLMQPIIHQFAVLAMLSIPFVAVGFGVALWLAMFSWLPFYFLVLQFGLYFVGLVDLKKHYGLSFTRWVYVFLPVFFIPYQLMLAFSALRAFGRMFLGITNWEKTEHWNVHRLVARV
jgi:cellulose synthase/poly-beta-1,6-N-acetylglucosamine synthase-like glycosyltransferase